MTAERSEAERAESDRRRIWQLGAFALAAVAVVAVWIVSVTSSTGAPKPTGGSPDVYPAAHVPPASDRSLTRAAARAGCTLRSFPSYGDGSTSKRVTYRTNPPTSGPHPKAAADGIYDDPPSTGSLVGALANGRVVFQFATAATAQLRGQLKVLANEDPRHVLLAVNQTSMPFAMAATAWRHYVGCSRANAAAFDALRDFRSTYRDQGG
ncbi:MAG TPA: DUF3105 domain-containing protein [Thermoleophilaceae bacterium]|jgi:hypothetical protein